MSTFMKVFLTVGLLINMGFAVLPPLDWRNYMAVVTVALCAFWLGVAVEDQQRR